MEGDWRERAIFDFGRVDIWRETLSNLKRKSWNHFRSEMKAWNWESKVKIWRGRDEIGREHWKRKSRVSNRKWFGNGFFRVWRERELFNTMAGYENNLSIWAIRNPSQIFTRFWDRFYLFNKIRAKSVGNTQLE